MYYKGTQLFFKHGANERGLGGDNLLLTTLLYAVCVYPQHLFQFSNYLRQPALCPPSSRYPTRYTQFAGC